MNLVITLLIVSFVVIPEVSFYLNSTFLHLFQSIADITADGGRNERTRSRKSLPADEKRHADEFQVVWHYGVSFPHVSAN
jgi:hypothetical protein